MQPPQAFDLTSLVHPVSVLVVGRRATGKTSLINRLTKVLGPERVAVYDDVGNNRLAHRSVRNTVLNGRHYDTSVLVASQTLLRVPPVQRINFDIIIITNISWVACHNQRMLRRLLPASPCQSIFKIGPSLPPYTSFLLDRRWNPTPRLRILPDPYRVLAKIKQALALLAQTRRKLVLYSGET